MFRGLRPETVHQEGGDDQEEGTGTVRGRQGTGCAEHHAHDGDFGKLRTQDLPDLRGGRVSFLGRRQGGGDRREEGRGANFMDRCGNMSLF